MKCIKKEKIIEVEYECETCGNRGYEHDIRLCESRHVCGEQGHELGHYDFDVVAYNDGKKSLCFKRSCLCGHQIQYMNACMNVTQTQLVQEVYEYIAQRLKDMEDESVVYRNMYEELK